MAVNAAFIREQHPLQSAVRRLLGGKLFFFQLGSSGRGPANKLTIDRLTGEKTRFIYTYTWTYSVMGNSIARKKKVYIPNLTKREGLQWEGMEGSVGLLDVNGEWSVCLYGS